MTKSVPRIYTDDFKLEAVKLAEETGRAEATQLLRDTGRYLRALAKSLASQKLFKNRATESLTSCR